MDRLYWTQLIPYNVNPAGRQVALHEIKMAQRLEDSLTSRVM